MEFPYGHHNHHHNRRNDAVEEQFPPPGRRPYDGPPPPQVTNVYHSSHEGGPPQPHYAGDNYGRPHYPPPPMEDNYGGSYNRPPPQQQPPPYSSNVQHVSHENSSSPVPDLMDKPSFRVYTKADPNYSLTIRQGKVVLASSDPSDPFQHWFKDERFSTKVKDEEGFPSFALVNKASGMAVKHSIGASHPVQLTPYDPYVLDASVLWTESRDVSDGYRAVRMVNNIGLNMDAWNADKEHGGVRDGTIVALWEWWKGDNKNQQWKIVPYCKSCNIL